MTKDHVLFQLVGANMQSTADQPFQQMYNGTTYSVSYICARQRSGACSILCLGGIYDGASKSGNAIVSAAQSWLTLASGVMVNAGLAALTGTSVLQNTPILSLTTGSTAPCTADIYIYGYDLS